MQKGTKKRCKKKMQKKDAKRYKKMQKGTKKRYKKVQKKVDKLKG